MRPAKKLALAIFALFLLGGALGAAAASAETLPSILCLEKACVAKFSGTFTSPAEMTLETLAGKTITATSAQMVLTKCDPVEGTEEKDTVICKDQAVTLKGVKGGGAGCNTEGDEKEVAKLLFDLQIAGGRDPGESLVPLAIIKVLNVKLLSPLVLDCAAIKREIRGAYECSLLPGLKNLAAGEKLKISCLRDQVTHDPLASKCEVLCGWLKEPLEANISGKFEDAALALELEGSLNKDIFIED